MNYNKIIHPGTGKVYSIFEDKGKSLLKSFIREFKLGGEGEIIAISSKLHEIILDYSLKFSNPKKRLQKKWINFFVLIKRLKLLQQI